MGAPQDAEHMVIEALHADGEPVHAKRPYVTDHGRGQAFGVRLHSAFHIGFQTHGKPQGVKQHGQPRHAHMGRSAAAKIHRRNASKLAFLRLAANLQAQVFHVFVDLRAFGGHGGSGEVAIAATLHAERQMQVQRAIRIMHGFPLSRAARQTRRRNRPRPRRR